jgi:hypothetical protein
MRLATCVCGQLSASCSGEPTLVSLCHCLACQRRTGSAFGIAAFFARANVTTSGQAHAYTRTSDSGHAVTFHFCPNCGASVFWEPDRKPDMIGVAVGSFADPSFPAPSQTVYDQHRHPWFEFHPAG